MARAKNKFNFKLFNKKEKGDKPKRLNRSSGGDFGINLILAIFGAVMVLPMVYQKKNYIN